MMEAVAVLYALLAVSQYGLVIVLLIKFHDRKRNFSSKIIGHDDLPGVSILVPVKGLIPTFETNFKSLLSQDYGGPLELVFGVKDENDPVLPAAKRILAETSTRTVVKFAVGQPDHGLNPKNSNLARAYALASHPWIYCSDIDVRLDPVHLRRCMTVVKGDPSHFATTMTVNERSENLGAQLESIGSNLEVASYFLIAGLNPKADMMNGASMFFHRSLIEKCGGFVSTVDRLTDDLFLGREFMLCGGRGHLVPGLVRETLARQSFEAFRGRFQRWILIAKNFRPELFVAAPFFWIWQWLFLLGLATMSPVLLALAAAVLSVRLLASATTQMVFEAPAGDFRNIWVLIVYDLLAPVTWFQCLFKREVVWSGNVMLIEKNGRLIRK